MELFKEQSLLEFTERFKTDLDCEEYLASLKWEDGYCCRKLRGIYSWVSEFNIDRYLAEYSFRINRSQSKETIFNKLIKKNCRAFSRFPKSISMQLNRHLIKKLQDELRKHIDDALNSDMNLNDYFKEGKHKKKNKH